jgi:hypothetical protein
MRERKRYEVEEEIRTSGHTHTHACQQRTHTHEEIRTSGLPRHAFCAFFQHLLLKILYVCECARTFAFLLVPQSCHTDAHSHTRAHTHTHLRKGLELGDKEAYPCLLQCFACQVCSRPHTQVAQASYSNSFRYHTLVRRERARERESELQRHTREYCLHHQLPNFLLRVRTFVNALMHKCEQ